jgi:phosphoribosylglycinamide formyltransferase-1
MMDMGVLASGNGSNLQALIDASEKGSLHARIKVVASDVPGAYALERAGRHGIPCEVITRAEYPSREDYDRELVRRLRSHGVELVALAGFMRILTRVALDAFPMKVVNIHPSLLPAFPGLDVQRKAIEYGARFSGCTVHFVDEGVDTGPIIIQAAVPIRQGDTPEELRRRILEEEHRIYPQAVRLISDHRVDIIGRRVYVRGQPEAGDAVENPLVTLGSNG